MLLFRYIVAAGAAGLDYATKLAGAAGQMIYNSYWQNENYRRVKELRDEQRAYDAPAAQMERLKAAGLNPNLVYSGMDNSAAAPAQAENPSMPYMQGSNFMAAVNAERQQQVADSQIALNAAQQELLEEKANTERVNTGYVETRRRYYERLINSQDIVDEYRKSGIDLNLQQVEQSKQYILLMAADEEVKKESAKLIHEQYLREQIKKSWDDRLLSAQFAKLVSEKRLNDQKAANLKQEFENVAEAWTYQLATIINNKEISDAQKERAIADKMKAMYESAKMQNIIKFTDTGKPIANGFAGAAYMTLDLVTGLVGRVFHFTGFENFTDKQQMKHLLESQTNVMQSDGDGVFTGGTLTTTRNTYTP